METRQPYGAQITADEFEKLPPDSHLLELVQGRVVKEPRPSVTHGAICVRIGSALHAHAQRTGAGLVLGNDTGFVLQRNPDTVRGPDVAFIRGERIDGIAATNTWFEGAPDIAVEVLSLSERRGQIEKKCREYIRAGAAVIWLVASEHKTVTVFEDGERRVVAAPGVLTCPALLPGFRLRVADIFE